jgi:hypothetical protein
MTVQFYDNRHQLLRAFSGESIHVPRRDECVVIGRDLYRVIQVTSRIHSDFTTLPVVEVELKKQ